MSLAFVAALALPAAARAQSDAAELAPVVLRPADAALAPLAVESSGAPLLLRFEPGEAPAILTRDPRLPEGHCTTPCALRVVPGSVHILAQSPATVDVRAAVDVPPRGLRAVLRPEGRARHATRVVFALGGGVTALAGLGLAFGGLAAFASSCHSSATQDCTSEYWTYAGAPGLLLFGGGLIAAVVGIVSGGLSGNVETHPPTFTWNVGPTPGGALAGVTLRL